MKNENLETSPTLSKGVTGESLITPCWDNICKVLYIAEYKLYTIYEIYTNQF